MSDYSEFPAFSVDLVHQLDELLPEKSPEKHWNDRDIWMYAGKRELINHLLQRLKNVEDKAYNKK